MARLEEYTVQNGKRLRKGYTTGSCAAAAAKAAALALLGGGTSEPVSLRTPSGVELSLEAETLDVRPDSVTCAVRKDAGDDPDATDGMLICAMVTRIASGFEVEGGEGVGRVTRAGLQCRIGEAAINPVPLEMIKQALAAAAEQAGYDGGLRALITVPGGAEAALRTFNARLGIEGGISILGTSGIVEPMSEAALVATIRAHIDQKRALGETALLLTPGNYGRDFALRAYGIDLDAGVKCSNFIGEALDYAVYLGFRRIVLIGHAGKLVKVAGGIMNTHSAVADARMEILACHCALTGGDSDEARRIYACLTVDEADGLLWQSGRGDAVWGSVAERLAFQLDFRTRGRAEVAFAVFCRDRVVMSSPGFSERLAGLRRMDCGEA